MSPELQLALELADRAGRLTLEYFNRKSLQVFSKRDATPVTEADRNAEILIREGISARYPRDGLLGEEFDEKHADNGRRWIIDPIDGTKSFIHGVPLYGVLIALEEEGLPRLGAVGFPALGQLFYAETAHESKFLLSALLMMRRLFLRKKSICSILYRNTLLTDFGLKRGL